MKSAEKLLEELVGPVTVPMLIRVYRTRNELRQDQLAKKLGVTVGFISNVETGKKPISLAKTLEICKKLKQNERYWAAIYFQQEAREAGLKNFKITIEDSRRSA